MSYLGGPLPGFERTEEEQRESINKAVDLVKNVGQALVPDIRKPEEVAQHFTELGSDIWRSKNLYKGVGMFVGKKVISQSPEIRKAVSLAKEFVDPVVQKTKKFLETDYLEPVYETIGVQPRGRVTPGVEEFQPITIFNYKRAPRTREVKQRIIQSEPFRPQQVKKQTWGNYIEKFGDTDSSLAAVAKAEESAAYLKKHGTLKGNNNTWTAPNGEVYYINNKTSRVQKARGEVNIGFDNLKSIQKTLEARSAGAKLNIDEINKIATELGWDKAKATRYIEESKQAKRTLEHLIKDLNKGEGRTMWSLGHRTAVKHLPHSADRALNIELEPLVDVLTKEGRKIAGNTGRAANDELGELLSKITNNPTDLRADMLHWGDDVIGKFMPRMREITDAKTFFEEIVKREDFIAKIKAYAKKNKVTLEEAGDVVMKPLMDKTPTSKAPYFE